MVLEKQTFGKKLDRNLVHSKNMRRKEVTRRDNVTHELFVLEDLLLQGWREGGCRVRCPDQQLLMLLAEPETPTSGNLETH